MLRKFLDWQLSLTEPGKPLHWLKPAIVGLDTFLYEPKCTTQHAPHIRDAVDLKRWMSIVVAALIPCILLAMWNTGMQSFVYGSGDSQLMEEFLAASKSFKTYCDFAMKDSRYIDILRLGAMAYVPIMLVSYTVGGIWELLFACIRKHEIAEGFLVSGMLYALILPPTIPYWMVAVGVSAGIVLSKELFGGTGMNIFNPAMMCRCFLFFTFPGQMSGDVWVGTNPTAIVQSIAKMNHDSGRHGIDAYSQATHLSVFNTPTDVKRVHVDAITSHHLSGEVGTAEVINHQLTIWAPQKQVASTQIKELDQEQLRIFITDPIDNGGLGLPPEHYEAAYKFSRLQNGEGLASNWNLFLGNKLGSMGETSALACILGALIMIVMKVASWRTMIATVLGAYLFASCFEWSASHMGVDYGAWNPAKYAFPAYKHLLLGGLAFGAVFMATDPVTSPGMNLSKWIYGLLIGLFIVVIRVINPAYPEGVMLAILLGNAFAPLIDHVVLKFNRRIKRV